MIKDGSRATGLRLVIPSGVIEPGYTYEWKLKEAIYDTAKDEDRVRELTEAGWEDVLKDGKPWEDGGLFLMRRNKELTRASLVEDYKTSREMVVNALERMKVAIPNSLQLAYLMYLFPVAYKNEYCKGFTTFDPIPNWAYIDDSFYKDELFREIAHLGLVELCNSDEDERLKAAGPNRLVARLLMEGRAALVREGERVAYGKTIK